MTKFHVALRDPAGSELCHMTVVEGGKDHSRSLLVRYLLRHHLKQQPWVFHLKTLHKGRDTSFLNKIHKLLIDLDRRPDGGMPESRTKYLHLSKYLICGAQVFSPL